MLERGDEREADRLLPRGHVGGVFALGQHPVVGDRLDPRVLGAHDTLERIRRRCGPEVHGPRSPLPAAEHVEAHVRRDPVEPGAQRRATLERIGSPPRAHHRLLHRVVSLEDGAEHAVAVAGQLTTVVLNVGEEHLAAHGPGVRGHAAAVYE